MGFFKKAYSYICYYGFMRSVFYFFKFLLLQLRRTAGIKRFAVKEINNRYKMHLDLKDRGISQALYLYGTREEDQTYIAFNNIKRDMKVLDIGANIGYYVLLEAQIVGEGGKVYAFEPHPGNVEMLKKNIDLNNLSDRIELHQKGISDRRGTMEFFISEKSNLHTLSPQYFRSESKKNSFKDSIEIGVVDIADLLLNKEIDFIRMDIEGHEVEVLRGLSRTIDHLEGHPSILFETHFPRYDDKHHNIRDVLRALFDKGYFVDTITSNSESKSPLRKMGYKPEKVIKTDGVRRGIYNNVNNKDALKCVCETGGIRALFLKCNKA